MGIMARKSKYYDWRKTLSYNAYMTMVIGARGIGKTYGLRKQAVQDFKKDGSRFVEVVRYKDELSTVTDGYFEKLMEKDEFPGYLFKTDKRYAYIAKCPEDEEAKPQWQVIGYFVPLSMWQDYKKKTFANVKRIIFDEAIIDRKLSPYKRYLPSEYDTLINMIWTVFREGEGHTYLLGNACDLLNPYMMRLKIDQEPPEGYSWHASKSTLVHYVQDAEYSEEVRKGMIGKLLGNSAEASTIIDNRFKGAESEYLAEKTPRSKFSFGLVYQGERFGVWLDAHDGYYYVNRQIPANTENIYSLSADDNRINYIAASRSNKRLRQLAGLHYLGIIRYSTAGVQQSFLKVLALFGVR